MLKRKEIEKMVYRQRRYLCSLTGEKPPKKGSEYYKRYADITLKRSLSSFYFFKSGTYLLTAQKLQMFSFVVDLWVTESWRKCGIGTKLLKRCGDNVILECAIVNPALEWYLRRGFTILQNSRSTGYCWLGKCQPMLKGLMLELVETLNDEETAENVD